MTDSPNAPWQGRTGRAGRLLPAFAGRLVAAAPAVALVLAAPLAAPGAVVPAAVEQPVCKETVVTANPSAGDSRALVRFGLPERVPTGCVVQSARLRMFTSSGSEGARVLAQRATSPWTENRVVWSTQPGTADPTATAWSRDGYMQWNVTAQVEAMFAGQNHGFLLRDAAEGTEEGGQATASTAVRRVRTCRSS